MAKVVRKIRKLLATLRPATGLSRDDSVPFDPMEIGGVTVRCQASWPVDHSRWNALLKRVPTTSVFQTPAWQIAAWKAGQISGRLRFLTVERGEELVGVLPLCVDDIGRVYTPGASITDYHDPLILAEAEPECWRAIFGFLAAQWDARLEHLTLYNLRERAACRTILPMIATANGFTIDEEVCEHSPTIPLPKTWDEYLDSLDPHERKETRRKLNKGETKGNARLVRCTEPGEISETLTNGLAMMESVGGEKGDAIHKYVRPLLEAVGVQLIQEGRIELHVLQINYSLACCLIEFPSATGPMLYNIGYDASLKEWSPGVVAVAMSIRAAIARGATEYDLLRGREPYKHRIGGVDRPVYRIILRKS